MAQLFRMLRNVTVIGWFTAAMTATAFGAMVWAVQLSATVATMSANAAATAVKHRKEIAQAVTKTKAKARLRRTIAAFPFVGVGAIGFFEERDYREWLEDHPDGTRSKYACEVSHLSAEVLDEVLEELPEVLRPEPNLVLDWMPDCVEGSNEAKP